MQNNFKVNRPLLNVHRIEIRQFVRFWKLPIYSDQSNQKTNYLRNKIRKQLMPTLRIFFNPQIDTVLLNFIEIQKNEQLYFQNVLKLLLTPQERHPLFAFFFYLSDPYCTELPYYGSKDDLLVSCLCFESSALKKKLRDERDLRFNKEQVISRLTNQRFVRACDYRNKTMFHRHIRRQIYDDLSTTCPKIGYLITHSFATYLPSVATTYLAYFQTGLCYWVQRNEAPGSFLKKLRTTNQRFVSTTKGRLTSLKFIQKKDNRKSEKSTSKKHCAKLIIQYKDYLNYFSRNQIIYWLITNNNLIKRLNSYPNIFQKQVLKTILKTFNQVENAISQSYNITNSPSKGSVTTYLFQRTQSIDLSESRLGRTGNYCSEINQKFKRIYQNKQVNEKKLTQLLILKFTKNLFVLREKRFLLFMLRDLINKY